MGSVKIMKDRRKKMELKDLTVEMILSKPEFKKIITMDGKKCDGQFVLYGWLLEFKDGILNNDVYNNGRIFAAIQGPGHIEYRNYGVLNNPDNEHPARVTEGFSKLEFWENGKFIKEEKAETIF